MWPHINECNTLVTEKSLFRNLHSELRVLRFFKLALIVFGLHGEGAVRGFVPKQTQHLNGWIVESPRLNPDGELKGRPYIQHSAEKKGKNKPCDVGLINDREFFSSLTRSGCVTSSIASLLPTASACCLASQGPWRYFHCRCSFVLPHLEIAPRFPRESANRDGQRTVRRCASFYFSFQLGWCEGPGGEKTRSLEGWVTDRHWLSACDEACQGAEGRPAALRQTASRDGGERGIGGGCKVDALWFVCFFCTFVYFKFGKKIVGGRV